MIAIRFNAMVNALVFARVLFLVCSVALAPSGFAQVPNTAAAAPSVALKGYDVVAYFTQNKAVAGSPSFSHDHDGMRYQFSDEPNKVSFVADPDRFLPQFQGHCSKAMSNGRKVVANPTIFKIVDGKLFVFSSPQARDDPDGDLLARAQREWSRLR